MSTPPAGNQGWGRGIAGASRWGSGVVPVPPGPPVITPLSPVDEETGVSQSAHLFIRITDDVNVNPATLAISIGPTVYVFGGVVQNGAVMTSTPNSGNGYDIELDAPGLFPLGVRQEVVVTVRDYGGRLAELTYYFDVGVGLRMMQVGNPSPNILVAHYNRPLLQSAALRSVSNWRITPISDGAAPLEISEVMTNPNNTDTVTLRYIGGGSTYKLTNSMVVDSYGDPIDPAFNGALFEILFGDEPDPVVTLFNTIYGPIGISKRQRLRRTMDDHVIGRSIAVGMDEQFRLRMRNLDGSAGRDGRPGKNRT